MPNKSLSVASCIPTEHCRQFRIAGMQLRLDEIISTAEKHNSGYIEFTFQLLDAESRHKQKMMLEDAVKQPDFQE